MNSHEGHPEMKDPSCTLPQAQEMPSKSFSKLSGTCSLKESITVLTVTLGCPWTTRKSTSSEWDMHTRCILVLLLPVYYQVSLSSFTKPNTPFPTHNSENRCLGQFRCWICKVKQTEDFIGNYRELSGTCSLK